MTRLYVPIQRLILILFLAMMTVLLVDLLLLGIGFVLEDDVKRLKCGLRCLMFDPTEPVHDVDFPDTSGLSQFYDYEPIPDDMPLPRGIPVLMTCYADASHASNKVTMRSHTGIFILLNSAPIDWYSKRQNTVESSTFGSEFIALRIATELCQGLRYKLRSFGIPINGPTSIVAVCWRILCLGGIHHHRKFLLLVFRSLMINFLLVCSSWRMTSKRLKCCWSFSGLCFIM